MDTYRIFVLGCALLLATSACGAANESAPPPAHESVSVDETTPVNDTIDPETEVAAELPADLHAVVFFDTERGHEHLDVRVRSDESTTTISGVRADESRANPMRHRIELSADERAEYGRLITALGEMPLCEPLGQLEDEPMWRIESQGYNDSGPSLWFRPDGATLMNGADPCLGYVRLAHFVYATWMAHVTQAGDILVVTSAH